ncbi:BolA family protein [Legionella birminghamensis]
MAFNFNIMNRTKRIEDCLHQHLSVHYLDVQDESGQHHVPQGAETHIKLILVSDAFKNQSRISRHRLINNLLADEFSRGLHALSMHLFTEEEWRARQGETQGSPPCRGGFNQG